MITYMKDINNEKKTPDDLVVGRLVSGTLINSPSPVLNSGFNIPLDTLVDYLLGTGNFENIDLFALAGFLKSTSLHDTISRSYIHGEKIIATKDELKKEYEKFLIESKMKFPYSINLYSANHIISFLDDLKKMICDLNYIAYVSDSKLDIDSTINQIKTNLKYELWVKCFAADGLTDCDITAQERILEVISPYFTDSYTAQSLPNNPFRNSDDYIFCLIAPHKYKLNTLESIKDVLNKDTNKLLAKLLEDGLSSLQKDVVTYRSEDIIKLSIICHYILYILIEYVIRFSQEFHDIASFIHGETTYDGLSGPEAYIPLTVHELLSIYKAGDYKYSHEAGDTMLMSDNLRLNEIDEAYKRKWAQLQKTYIKIFKVGISKILSHANALFLENITGESPISTANTPVEQW
jgi:hypothetical protein